MLKSLSQKLSLLPRQLLLRGAYFRFAQKPNKDLYGTPRKI
jgi:hypothetical protein